MKGLDDKLAESTWAGNFAVVVDIKNGFYSIPWGSVLDG